MYQCGGLPRLSTSRTGQGGPYQPEGELEFTTGGEAPLAVLGDGHRLDMRGGDC